MMLNLLKEFVEVYHRNKGLGELIFTSDCLHVEKPDLSGQLKEFYQHLDFDEEAYFRGVKDMILMLARANIFKESQ